MNLRNQVDMISSPLILFRFVVPFKKDKSIWQYNIVKADFFVDAQINVNTIKTQKVEVEIFMLLFAVTWY